jgi:TonB family protein
MQFKKISTFIFLLASFSFYAQDGHIDTLVGNDGRKYINKTFEYPGGLQALNKDVFTAFVFPKTASNDKIHGKILLEFTVDTLGRASYPKIVEGLRADVDSAAIKVCKKLKRFKPSTIDGKKVPQRMNIPLTL